MQSRLTLAALPFVSLFFALGAGCDCSNMPPPGGIGSPCTTSTTCNAGLTCRDGTCQVMTGVDAGPLDAAPLPGSDTPACPVAQVCAGGRTCCATGEECVDDFACAPVCANERCGDNRLTCCDADEQCLDGVVCAARCDAGRALCGEDLDTCCGEGEVCVEDACVAPGDTCMDDFDCLTEGTYCEFTIGACLPNPRPPLCEVRPAFDRIALEVEWHWEGETVGGTTYGNVVINPTVGDVSGDGIADVVVAAYAGNDLDSSILAAIHGRTGATLWTVSGTNGSTSQSAAAVADLDPSDPGLEVVYLTRGAALVVLDGETTTELARLAAATTAGHADPSIHDLDRDGDAEIVIGARAFAFEAMGAGFTLRELFNANLCNTNGSQSVVANLDDDPELEITCGGMAFDTDGARLWPASGGTVGYAAVADLDLDGAPEVVDVRSSTVTVRAGATGAVLIGAGGTWLGTAMAIPGGGVGGPPTIADFDGDGLPEISAAGSGAYAVYDPDCIEPRIAGREAGACDRMMGTTDALRWSAPVQDLSSSRTGSSVFDFQGDGVSEVVYNDECFLHVFDGRTGEEVLMEPWPNSSRTGQEYPLVVDVDRDGNSEIVVPANNDQVTRDGCRASYRRVFGYATDMDIPEAYRNGTHGIFVLGDPGDRWVRTRPIWNQLAYSVTHVDDRGAVPATPPDNWTVPGLNNFRANVQGAGVFNAPNLTVDLEIVAACGRAEILLSAVVRNVGSRGVAPGVPIEFVQTMPAPGSTLATLATTRPLLPGGSERITATATMQPYDTDLAFAVRVDGEMATSTITECDEDDNGAEGTGRCPGLD
ncbi:MAG: hypothetical protein J0L92_34390 [Deltaproteobacteria bacterium]|nr:hypothetical protein [Deltaproteobacteria bacterium]